MDDDLTPAHSDGRPRRWESLEARLDAAAPNTRPGAHDRPVRPRTPRPLLTIFVVAVALFCLAFMAAPLFAFRAVRSAAEYGDVKALEEEVDYGAVRQSLRTQVRPASAERNPPADVLRDPLGALRRALEPVRPQSDVDRYLTPDALASLAQGGGLAGTKAVAGRGLFGGPVPAVRYWGFDRVRLGVADPAAKGRETIFTFQRRAMFEWRLVAVRLPETI